MRGTESLAYLLVLGFGAAFIDAAYPVAVGSQPVSTAPSSPVNSIAITRKDLNAAYQVHLYLRNQIAERLDQGWAQEHEISCERDRLGRAGDMASVIQLERDLLAVRQEIDKLRESLSKENRIIALIDRQMTRR